MRDEDYMRRALELAARGVGAVNPNPMVGAVIVKDGRIIGEGWHERFGQEHAERRALAALTESCEGACIYVTLEPCCHHGKQPPCTDALIASGISRVVIGSGDPNPLVSGKGTAILREHGIEVKEGVLREECDSLNRVFFHYITTGRPYVRMKYAMTADGKIATRTGSSKWISCEASRVMVQEWRRELMGIMVGIGTVLADDPQLTCRIPDSRDPVRIICDSSLRIPEDARVCSEELAPGTIIACCGAERFADKAARLREKGIRILDFPGYDRVPPAALLERLGELGIDGILLEGGGCLNESFIKEGLADEINVFLAPKIFGGTAPTPVSGMGVALADEAFELELTEAVRVGDDMLLRYRPGSKAGESTGA